MDTRGKKKQIQDSRFAKHLCFILGKKWTGIVSNFARMADVGTRSASFDQSRRA